MALPAGAATALRAGAPSGIDPTGARVPTSMTSAVGCWSLTVRRRVPSALAARPLTLPAMVPTYRVALRSTRSIPRGVGTTAIVRPALTTGAAIGGSGRATRATTADLR